jgi:hypothetical protein
MRNWDHHLERTIGLGIGLTDTDIKSKLSHGIHVLQFIIAFSCIKYRPGGEGVLLAEETGVYLSGVQSFCHNSARAAKSKVIP